MYTYNIFDETLRLRDLVDTFFTEASGRTRRGEYPLVEIYEGNDNIEIRALMPGVSSDNLDVHLVNDSLVIEGEKREDYSDKPYLRKERNFGNFKKSVKLPYRVDPNTIKADLKNGILLVSLSKAEEAKPKKIDIT